MKTLGIDAFRYAIATKNGLYTAATAAFGDCNHMCHNSTPPATNPEKEGLHTPAFDLPVEFG